MIISHKHKFIFVKTRKTAGTSIEIALSKYCQANDIITPIEVEDEYMRERIGYRGPQNYYIPLRKYKMKDWINLVKSRDRLMFYNHISAVEIKKYIDADVWNTYFKFCFERNPFDKIVSVYYFLLGKGRTNLSLEEFLSQNIEKYSDFKLYTIDNEIAVDRVYEFENIQFALSDISKRLNFNEPLNLQRIKAKSVFRPDDRNDMKVLENSTIKESILKAFKREIEYFNYQV